MVKVVASKTLDHYTFLWYDKFGKKGICIGMAWLHSKNFQNVSDHDMLNLEKVKLKMNHSRHDLNAGIYKSLIC